MGSGVSHHRLKKVERQKESVNDNDHRHINNSEQEKKETIKPMEAPSSVQNNSSFGEVLSRAQKSANVLKEFLSDGNIASAEGVSCCEDLLKFSGTMDESEDIKTTSVNFVLGQNIAGIIFEIYRALLEKYPKVVKYDREKVEVSVIK